LTCSGPELRLALSEPVWAPVDVGLKVTEIAQLPFAGRELGQLFVCANWPEAAMLVTLTEVASVLLSVAVCAALVAPTVVDGKESDVGVNVTLPDAVAVPDKLTCSGPELRLALSEPLWLPVEVGAKVTEIVQLPLAGRELGQLFVCANWALAVMLETLTAVA
jgi:hypothetical protein